VSVDHRDRQTALKGEDLSHTYLAHLELESKFIVIVVIIIINILHTYYRRKISSQLGRKCWLPFTNGWSLERGALPTGA